MLVCVCAEIISYPSNSPQPHDPVCKYQSDSHTSGYGFLWGTSGISHQMQGTLLRTLVSGFLAITSKIQ